LNIKYPTGKLELEESTMTVTLTLNEITAEQASAVLGLIKARNTAPSAPAETGEPLFEENAAQIAANTTAIPTAAPSPAPIPVTPPAPAAIPAQTTVQHYTVPQLGLAARPLMENGRQQELIALLAEFGVQSVAALPEDRRADFAARLRAMGGLI
jgi:hypothetical protein